MHARRMYDRDSVLQSPVYQKVTTHPNIRSTGCHDKQESSQQIHQHEYQTLLDQRRRHQQHVASLYSTNPQSALFRQSHLCQSHKASPDPQTAFPRHVQQMTQACPSSYPDPSQLDHGQYAQPGPGGNEWRYPHCTTAVQTYLDPSQLQTGNGQSANQNIGLGVHGVPHSEQGNASGISQYPLYNSFREDLPQPRLKQRHIDSRQSTPFNSSPSRDVAELDAEAEDDDAAANEPYNQLLHRCLLQQPYHELLLKDIYEWFKVNTDKGRDPRQKGWQNSIRHNLSMNPAFHKGSRSQPGASITNMWSLTDKAIEHGVEPTTRFRNHNRPYQKSRAYRNAVPQRQLSGAKGGRAARRSARLRALATPDDSRSPSPAVGYYNANPNANYQYANAFGQSMNQCDPWQTVYNGYTGNGPYYFNHSLYEKTSAPDLSLPEVDFANQFDANNNFTFGSSFGGNQMMLTPPDSGQPPSVPQVQVHDSQNTPFETPSISAPVQVSSTSTPFDYKISGVHGDAHGEPLFTNSGDEDSSVEFEMPRTPPTGGEPDGWNDEGAGVFFNFDDK